MTFTVKRASLLSRTTITATWEMIPAIWIPGNGETGNGQFNPKREFNGGTDQRIEPKDLLLAIWILQVFPHRDRGIPICGQLGTAKKKGICVGTLPQNDFGKDVSFENKIKAGGFTHVAWSGLFLKGMLMT